MSGPSFLSDDNGDGREVATLSLTPAGKVFVDGVATTMVERRNVTFYAYVRDPAAALQDCGSIKEAVKPGVLASKSIELALEQKPPVPAKTP